jgi:hypothetical protein
MAQRFSISSKQAVLAGLGITALITGVVIAVSHSKKKKQLQQKPAPKNTKSLMV